jgi:uncharacterized membrane protein YccC
VSEAYWQQRARDAEALRDAWIERAEVAEARAERLHRKLEQALNLLHDAHPAATSPILRARWNRRRRTLMR